MSFSLRTGWIERLQAAQNNFSWQAQIEARVLRFLLSRYKVTGGEAPLVDFPLQEGDEPYGRAHSPLSQRQLRGRLNHIATTATEAHAQPPSISDRAFEAHMLLLEETQFIQKLVAEVVTTSWAFLSSRWPDDAQYQYEEDRRKQRERNRW